MIERAYSFQKVQERASSIADLDFYNDDSPGSVERKSKLPAAPWALWRISFNSADGLAHLCARYYLYSMLYLV